MNTNEAADIIQLISTYDNKATPRDDNRAKLKANEWAMQLDKYPAHQVAHAIREHYRKTDTTITIAALRHYLHAEHEQTTRSRQHRTQRTLDIARPKTPPPPADLLDRTNTCPECDATPGNPCQPQMPFDMNHIDRNPISRTNFDQHDTYEELERAERTGIICECCGKHTSIPA